MDKEKVEKINKLIREVRAGNNESFNKLYEIMATPISYIAMKYFKNKEDAQDVVQDFWADIYKLCSAFVFSQNGFSFLCKAMTRKTISAYRKTHGKKIIINYVDFECVDKDKIDGNYEKVDNRILISKAISQLSELQKIIIQEIYIEQKTPREIAKILHIGKTTVYKEKNLAIEKLKEILGKDGQI